jgi:hypothetical protein
MSGLGFVARIERKRNPGPVSPDFASLNPGYGLREVTS